MPRIAGSLVLALLFWLLAPCAWSATAENSPKKTEQPPAQPPPSKAAANPSAGKMPEKAGEKANRGATNNLAADEKTAPATPAAGHSLHGEAFDQGPRQAAYLMGGTGNVSFPITTRAPKAQEFFNQGVGQLHGFWYFEAERSFRQASALDPACPMPYWGMAMANVNNAKRARGLIAEAVKRQAAAGPRERLWIESLDEYYRNLKSDQRGKQAEEKARRQYVRRLENIIHEHDDLEAKAFLAGKIWENSSHGVPIDSFEAADALIREVLAKSPGHPVHHYRIHLWDGEKPQRALDAAARCGPAAPAIAHMWHMPGHTYSKLARYADAAWQQEASSRVDHAYMMHDFVLPDQIHNYAHNEEWLIRNLVFLGRARQGIDLAKCLVELPRHPRYNQITGTGSASYGRTRLMDVLERYELWSDFLALDKAGYLETLKDNAADSRRMALLGAAYFYTGNAAGGREQIAGLEGLVAAAKKAADAKEAAAKTAETKTNGRPGGRRAAKSAEKARADKLKTLEQALALLRGHEALAAGNAQAAVGHFERAGAKDKVLLSRAYLAAGNSAKAEELARGACESGKHEFYPLASYVEVLWRLDKKLEAGKKFELLRTVGYQSDRDLPICDRLKPIALERGISGDWRSAPPTPEDIGVRPPLAKLGPFRWQPPAAPPWEALDADGKTVSGAQYRGRPLLVVFYLGFGCVHCVEQLKAFSPLAEEFKKAGIQIVAIGTDKVEDLADSSTPGPTKSKGKQPAYSFPLLSDSSLAMFRRFRAYDDFEKQPLHGVFLVDAAGRLRWQDINYEPFTDAAFVLKESQRLLNAAK